MRNNRKRFANVFCHRFAKLDPPQWTQVGPGAIDINVQGVRLRSVPCSVIEGGFKAEVMQARLLEVALRKKELAELRTG